MKIDDMSAFHGQDDISTPQHFWCHLHGTMLADIEAALSTYLDGIDRCRKVAGKKASRCGCPRNRSSGQFEAGD